MNASFIDAISIWSTLAEKKKKRQQQLIVDNKYPKMHDDILYTGNLSLLNRN